MGNTEKVSLVLEGILEKVVDIDEVEPINGVLSYKGRQILLYIPDHVWNVEAALEDGRVGNKYHIADCRTLEMMRDNNRFERYIATNDLSGYFKITGTTEKNNVIEGRTNLSVCKNCLSKINYKNYNFDKKSVFDEFSIEDFFDRYSQFFSSTPSRRIANKSDSCYAGNWKEISDSYKAKNNYCCEECHIDLVEYKELLHTHHINGVKSDNRDENFKSLCLDCHRQEPNHQHMKISSTKIKKIHCIRRDQKKYS